MDVIANVHHVYPHFCVSAVPKRFWGRPKSEFGEPLMTQASNRVCSHQQSNYCMDYV